MTKSFQLIILCGLIVVYVLVLKNTFVNIPIMYNATILHELGHAFACELTGGDALSIDLNEDGSGVTTTSGGNGMLITMGGFIGSCIFGNLIMLCSLFNKKISRIFGYGMSILNLFCCFYFGKTEMFTIFLFLVFSVGFFLLSYYKIQKYPLFIIGFATTMYVIMDYNVGPSSDIQQFSNLFGNIISVSIWKYVWLCINLVITSINVYFSILFFTKNNEYEYTYQKY